MSFLYNGRGGEGHAARLANSYHTFNSQGSALSALVRLHGHDGGLAGRPYETKITYGEFPYATAGMLALPIRLQRTYDVM